MCVFIPRILSYVHWQWHWRLVARTMQLCTALSTNGTRAHARGPRWVSFVSVSFAFCLITCRAGPLHRRHATTEHNLSTCTLQNAGAHRSWRLWRQRARIDSKIFSVSRNVCILPVEAQKVFRVFAAGFIPQCNFHFCRIFGSVRFFYCHRRRCRCRRRRYDTNNEQNTTKCHSRAINVHIECVNVGNRHILHTISRRTYASALRRTLAMQLHTIINYIIIPFYLPTCEFPFRKWTMAISAGKQWQRQPRSKNENEAAVDCRPMWSNIRPNSVRLHSGSDGSRTRIVISYGE